MKHKERNILRRMTALLLAAVMLLPAVAGSARAAEGQNSDGSYSETLNCDPFHPQDEGDSSLQETQYSTTFDNSKDENLGDQLERANDGTAYNVYQALKDQLSNNLKPSAEKEPFAYTYNTTDSEGNRVTNKASEDYFYYTVKQALAKAVEPYDLSTSIHAAYNAWRFDYPLDSCDTCSLINYTLDDDKKTYELHVSVVGNPVEDRTRLSTAVDAFDREYQKQTFADDCAKFKFIHDYICSLAVYNYDSIDKPDYFSEVEMRRVHSAYGALVGLTDPDNKGIIYGKGSIVCEGYTNAFRLLCKKENLTCVSVTGYSKEDGETQFPNDPGHIWNYIKLGTNWYAVDLTWDDDMTRSQDQTVAIVKSQSYSYFGYNKTFNGDNSADHKEYKTFGGTTCWTFDFPDLDYEDKDIIGVSTWSTWETNGNRIVVYTLPTQSDFSNVVDHIQKDKFRNLSGQDGFALSGASEVDFNIMSNQTLDKTCTVPLGKTYALRCIQKDNEGKVIPYTLSRASGFDGVMFQGSESGSSGSDLDFNNVVLEGSSSGNPIIRCTHDSNLENYYFASLSLGNITVQGNKGAYAIETDSPIYLYGTAVIDENTSADKSVKQNVLLTSWDASFYFDKGYDNNGSSIGFEKQGCGYYAQDNGGFDAETRGVNRDTLRWNKTDKNIAPKLITDTLTGNGYFSPGFNYSGEKSAELCYRYIPFAAYDDEQDLWVKNFSGKTMSNLKVMYAAYSGSGKMISIKLLGTVNSFDKEGFSDPLKLPVLPSTVAYAKLFVLDADGKPLCDDVMYGQVPASSTQSLEEYESPQTPEIHIPSAA